LPGNAAARVRNKMPEAYGIGKYFLFSRAAWSAAALLLILSPDHLPAQLRRHSPDRNSDALQIQDALWVGTDRGLFRYRGADNTWSMRGAESGLISNRITRLFGEADALWIGTDQGVTRHDLRANSTTSWRGGGVLPPGRVLCFAAGEDDVWAGTENGAARFDKLIEQWQRLDASAGLAGEKVFEIGIREGRAWLAPDSAINEYDPRYERWRIFRDPDGGSAFIDAFSAGPYFWLLREHEFLRFDPSAGTFQRYSPQGITSVTEIRMIFIDGSSIWIQASDNLWQYDAQNDGFRPFRDVENLPDRRIQAVAMAAAADIWFATEAGLTRYEERATGKVWTPYTTAGGLPFTQCRFLFPSGGGVTAFTDSIIATLRVAESRWLTLPLPAPRDSAGATYFTLDPSRGTGFVFGGGWRLSFTGSRASWLIREPLGSGTSTSQNFDLKARLDLGGKRTITASYNDVDYSDVRIGAEYRGAENDLLQVLQAGDVRVEQGARSLLQSFGLYGGAGRIDIGARTPKYSRPLLELSAAAGHQTTATVTEVFVGGNTAKYSRIIAGNFRRREFFRLDEEHRDLRIGVSPFDLYLEQTAGSAPTRNSLVDESIAGKTATWLRLEPARDYSLDAERGIVRMTAPVDAAALAARFTAGGAAREVILSSPTDTSREMRNVYFVGARNIIPRTFFLDPTAPEWGLDRDGDGRVDAEFMDYENGFLRFPSTLPFPLPGRVIEATFLTTTPSYSLKQNRLIRGSERLLVDGRLMKAGEDYVLDYTSGALSFTRDGAVLDDSRIEITYEHVSNDPERRYAQAGVTASPSDFLQASVCAGNFGLNRDAGSEYGGNTTYLHALAEARVQSGALDLRMAPEFSRSFALRSAPGISGSDSRRHADAMALFTAASYGPARLTLHARSWDPAYESMFERDYAGGTLLNQTTIEGEIDITSSLRVFGTWQGRGDEDGWKVNESTLDGGIRWFETDLPSITLRFLRGAEGYSRIAQEGETLHRRGAGLRNAIRADVQYTASPGMLGFLGLSSANLVSYFRYAVDDHPPASTLPWTGTPDSITHLNMYLRINASPRPMFAVSTYYRGDLQYSKLGNEELLPVFSNERLFADAVMEHITGISATARYTDDLRLLYTPCAANSWNADSRRSAQLGARLSPGVLLQPLRFFTLELNARREIQEYLTGGRDARPAFLSHFLPRDGAAERQTISSFLESRLEWRPAAGLLGTTIARFTETGIHRLQSAYLDRRRDLVQRVDIQTSGSSMYTLQISYIDGRNPWSDYRRLAPNLWTEQRWGEYLLGRFTINALHEIRNHGADVLRSGEFQPGANLTLQLPDLSWLPKTELRCDLSLRYGESASDPSPTAFALERIITRSVTNSISLDIYPIASSYLRFVFSTTVSGSSPAGVTVSTTSSTLQAVLQL